MCGNALLARCESQFADCTIVAVLHCALCWSQHVIFTRGQRGGLCGSRVQAVKRALSIPVLANGNVRTLADAEACLAYTGALSGVTCHTGHHPLLMRFKPMCRVFACGQAPVTGAYIACVLPAKSLQVACKWLERAGSEDALVQDGTGYLVEAWR